MARILLVEDNEMNADMLQRRLERRGFEVSVAFSGAEAIDQVAADRPDLVLMDLSLPEMDGLEVTRRLRGRPETRALPIIALTAHAHEEDRRRSLEAGCDDHETKPIDFPRLLEKIERLLVSRPERTSA